MSDAHILQQFTGSSSVANELVAYSKNAFLGHTIPTQWPLEDEPFLARWKFYAEQAEAIGAWATLFPRFPQLWFPIQQGISQSEAYISATRRGTPQIGVPQSSGLQLHEPQALHLHLKSTPAGHIPVLFTNNRADFELLLQALAMRSEPSHIPPSQGAAIIAGFNNWDRINALRLAWAAEHPNGTNGWNAYFQREIVPHKDLYQDKFILLSGGAYSDVPAIDLGLSEADWLAYSKVIRTTHEATHYFTRRVFGVMQNNAHDELMADYMGIRAALGHYDVSWFLRFMGLSSEGNIIHPEGRLHNYRGQLTPEAFAALGRITAQAAYHLAKFDDIFHPQLATLNGIARALLTLTELSLLQLAAPTAVAQLAIIFSARS
jgi:hypothetical protein